MPAIVRNDGRQSRKFASQKLVGRRGGFIGSQQLRAGKIQGRKTTITTNCYMKYPPGHSDDNNDEGDVDAEGKSRAAGQTGFEPSSRGRRANSRRPAPRRRLPGRWHGGLRAIYRIQAKNLTNCEEHNGQLSKLP